MTPAQQRRFERLCERRPFGCPHCERRFRVAAAVNDHILAKHPASHPEEPV